MRADKFTAHDITSTMAGVLLLAGLGLLALFGEGAASARSDNSFPIEATPERLARGEYLVEAVMNCAGCHSERQLDSYNFVPLEGLKYGGGIIFGPAADGSDEIVLSANITPGALADWSDGDIFRVLTKGVRPDGRLLDPAMPYELYRLMEREELYAVIVYLRTLQDVPARGFPARKAPRTPPRGMAPALGTYERPGPDAGSETRGQYLVRLGHCSTCHAGAVDGAPTQEPFSGGLALEFPGVGGFYPANLTPDVETGLGSWTRAQFIERFKSMAADKHAGHVVPLGEPNFLMSWAGYGQMTEADLGAIYDYLRTVPPVRREIRDYRFIASEDGSTFNWSGRR